MAATLTNVQPLLYSAAQVVSQESIGILDSINLNFDDRRVALGDTVRVPVAPALTASDFTASNAFPDGANTTASKVDVAITKSRKVSWDLTGEQIRSLDNGAERAEWVRQLIAQGIRTLSNEAEVDAAAAIKQGASRAYGTAGTTPFASSIADAANVLKILIDNGAPRDGQLTLAINTAAGLNLRSLANLVQVYQAGTDETIRKGVLLDLYGIKIKESAGIATHTKGTGASYVTSGSTAVGVTDIALVTGTGTVLAGDVVTFAADSTNKYVVGTGVSAPGTISLNRPGARVTIATANAMTVGNNYTPNVAFHRSAVVGVMRAPDIPMSAVIDQQYFTDPNGRPFLLLMLNLYGKIVWELHSAWGFKVVNPEHVATLLG